jgi:PAS domain S-box-containing protein
VLAESLNAISAELLARIEGDAPPGQTAARFSELLRELVAKLRAEDQATTLPSGFGVDERIDAARLLKNAVFDAIDRGELRASANEQRDVAEWFSDLVEQELRAGHKRVSDILDAVPDHLLVIDLSGEYLYLSRQAGAVLSKVVGVTPDEMVGKNVDDVASSSPESLRESMRSHNSRVFEHARRGEISREEMFLPHGNGRYRWRERHAGPLRGMSGEVDAVVVASRDITDRKTAEARLAILTKLGALTDTLDHENIIHAIAQLSIPELADWCLISVLQEGHSKRDSLAHRDPTQAALAEEILQLPSQLENLRVMDSALAGEATMFVDISEEKEPELSRSEIVQRLGIHSAIVVPIVVLDRTVALATFMLTPASGRQYSDTDFSLAQEMCRRAAQMIENAQLHEQLAQSEARFRFALEHASISVFETDPTLRFRWSYNSMVGQSDRQVVGQSIEDVLGSHPRVVTSELPTRVLQTGEGARGAFEALVNGKKRHFMIRYEALQSSGEIVGLSGATIDITDLKEAEEQLARELGYRERMMGILGHDLRNPVSAVLGLTELMLTGDLNDKARQQLGFVRQAARRMNEMIGTLLDFTRLRFTGALPVTLARVGLDELARDVVDELRAANRGRTIELATSGNLRGTWDPGRIAQLFTNLVANGLTHGERGSPVWIDLSGEQDDVVLSVSNRGGPIESSVASGLFEPFKQGDENSTSRRGLGLGLFIVREIVRAHSGSVDLRSSDGRVTLTAKLPRGDGARRDH